MSEKNEISESEIKSIGGFDEKRIINKDYLNTLKGIYKCGICFKIMDNPTDCETCGHSYCYECIKNLKCPFNCKTKKLKPSSQNLKDMLSKLKFKCINKDCEQILNYSDVKNHDKNCDFQEIICPNKSCNKKLIKKDLENHVLNECEYSLVKCHYCEYLFNKNDITNHEKSCSIVNNVLKSNKKENDINSNNDLDINNIDINEYIKLLSMNVSKIVKDNQELMNNNINNENNENKKIEFSQVAFRPSNPANYAQIDEDELLNLISDGIEEELKKYFLDFEKNFLKLSKDIKDIKEHLINKQHQQNIIKPIEMSDSEIKKDDNKNILIMDETNNMNKIENIKDEKKDNINDISDNYIKDVFSKTEISLKKAINDMNEKILDNLKNFGIKLEENIKKNGGGNTNTLTNQQKLIIENINNSIDKIIENIQSTKSNINILSNELHTKIPLLEELNKNLISSLDNKAKDNNINNININENKIQENKDNITNNNFEKEIEDIQTTLSLIKNNVKQVTKTLTEEFADLTELIQTKNNNIKQKENGNIIETEENITINNNKKKSDYLSLNIDSLHKFSFGMDIPDKTKIQTNNLLLNANKNNSFPENQDNYLLKPNQNFSLQLINIKNNNSSEIKFPKNKISFSSKENNEENENINSNINLQLNNNIESRMTNLENFSKNFETEMKQNIINQFNNQAQNFNSIIEKNLDNKIEKMFSLKYCKECEKVDYFYAFKKCALCGSDNCKQCITLCINCKILYCKNCCTCLKCNKSFCNSCRILCTECNKKYCKTCLMNCSTCNKVLCLSCIKQCFICKNNNCGKYCSKTCYICYKNICNKCQNNELQITTCSSCNSNICQECTKLCELCKKKICKNCLKYCKKCGVGVGGSCRGECHDCKNIFCKKCCEESLEKKCDLCNKIFCKECENNFGNCYVCMQNICKNCCSKCLCGNIYCNTCSLECEKCGKRICNNCSGKCVCDIAVFCDDCLKQNTETVLMHDCLYFINDSSTFDKKKTRSKSSFNVNDNFEIKIYITNINRLSKLLVGFTDNGVFSENEEKEISNIYVINLINGKKLSSENKKEEPFFDMNLIKEDNICVYLMVKNKKLFIKINNSEYKSGFDLTKDEYYVYLEKINSDNISISNPNNSNNNTNSEFISDDFSLGSPKVKFIYAKKL